MELKWEFHMYKCWLASSLCLHSRFAHWLLLFVKGQCCECVTKWEFDVPNADWHRPSWSLFIAIVVWHDNFVVCRDAVVSIFASAPHSHIDFFVFVKKKSMCQCGIKMRVSTYTKIDWHRPSRQFFIAVVVLHDDVVVCRLSLPFSIFVWIHIRKSMFLFCICLEHAHMCSFRDALPCAQLSC